MLLSSLQWSFLQAKAVDPQLVEGRSIGRIVFEGLHRTQPFVVLRELLVSEGQPFVTVDLESSVQRLRNLRLFSRVQTNLSIEEDGALKIIFEFSEKWTTLPIFKIAQGGGTKYLVAGIYDINYAGSFLELGAQYESWNDQPGAVVWFRQPRFLGRRMRIGADLWSVKRPRDLYLPNGTKQGHYVLDQEKFNGFLEWELSQTLVFGFGVEADKDRYLSIETSELLDKKTTDKLINHDETSWVFVRAFLRLGRLNYNNFLIEGRQSEITVTQSVAALGSDESFYRLEWDNRVFWQLPWESNLGVRFRLGETNSTQLQYLYYIGGFESIRGYEDGQFRGNRFWQANVEYRLPSYKWPWLVLQHNVFLDIAQVTDFDDLLGDEADDINYSWGIGLRLISPKIYRFIGRFDFVVDGSKTIGNSFSFGVQQFF